MLVLTPTSILHVFLVLAMDPHHQDWV